MNASKLLEKLKASPKNARFQAVCQLAEAFGFVLDRITGSHHIFVHPTMPELLNLQEVRGKAKPYQVWQLLRLVERYNLSLGDEA